MRYLPEKIATVSHVDNSGDDDNAVGKRHEKCSGVKRR